MNMPLSDDPTLLRAAADAPALETRGLSVSYAGVVRLRNVTVSFPRNRVTAVLGPSGCGKSTLLKALNRTLELVPDARIDCGRAFLDATEIYSRQISPSWVRTRIGMLQQRPTPFPMSIEENVIFGARYHGLVHDRHATVRRYLELVGLWEDVHDRLGAPARTLSGGQQQRLCVARTLAVQPLILLMDEPCSALDPRATALIEQLIRELVRSYTIVVVTHNIAQARRIGDRCVFMIDGEVIAAGTREEILVDPREPAVRDFVTGRIG